MAAGGQAGEFSSESARLREEIVNLISRRLEENVSKKPKNLGISKVLSKRKRKWRKKHKLEAIKPAYKPVDDQLRQEKETTEDTQIGLKDVLFHRRQEAFAIARQLEREKGAYHLESISHRLQLAQDEYKVNLLSQQNDSPHIKLKLSHAEQFGQLLAEMEGAMAQASALKTIRQMKCTMTPRFAPLHNRTLSSNILDTTLGMLDTTDQPEVTTAPLDSTIIAPELHAIDSESELDHRDEVASGYEADVATYKLNDFDVHSMRNDEVALKTYANVRLSTESVPLQLSSGGEMSSLVGSSPKGALQGSVAMTTQHPVASQTLLMANVSVPHDDSMSATVSHVADPEILPIATTPPHLSTTSYVINKESPPPQTEEDRRLTYTKDSPLAKTSVLPADVNSSSGLPLQQEAEVRAMAEHSYAKMCTDHNETHHGAARMEDILCPSPSTTQVNNEHQAISDGADQLVTAASQDHTSGTAVQEEAPSMVNEIEGLNVGSGLVSNTGVESKETPYLKSPLVVQNSRLDGFNRHPPTSAHLEAGGMKDGDIEPEIEGATTEIQEPVAFLPSGIDEQVLEVAVIEPESDVPMPVEYTVVTQQETVEEPPPREESPPPHSPDFDNTRLVNEYSNESGESIVVGCEVTTSTMELTDVTSLSGGSNTVSTAERQAQDLMLTEDISCETVIITTSAMNSTRPGGYTTPSEDSDGTTNSLETRGDGAVPTDEKRTSDMITTNDDGTDSDAVFEDILKQIESAPYELRISNIVLAQLSRAASKSPPSSKKKRKRRSMAKKWTRTKGGKKPTPQK